MKLPNCKNSIKLILKFFGLSLFLYLGSFLGALGTKPYQSALSHSYIVEGFKTEEIKTIESMISKLAKNVAEERRKHLAKGIFKVSGKYKIRPEIMVAIIDTESNFRQHVVSKTGDVSLAQINPKVWNRELVRIGREPLDVKKLLKNEEYALERMAEILSIVKSRIKEEDDSAWFGHYHSRTEKLKKIYFRKVQKRIDKITTI